MAKLSVSSGRKSSEKERRANAEENRTVKRPAFPKLASTGQLFTGNSSATTPTLTNATTSPNNGNFSPASVQSPISSIMRPKTAGAEASVHLTSAGFASSTQLQRQQWADMMMTGSPIEVVADDDTYMFPTPLRRPSTATNSAAASPVFPGASFTGGNAKGISAFPRSNFSPALGTPLEEESDDKSWPLRGPGMKPVRAHTAKDFSTIEVIEKPKLSRWKSLGGFFGKKKVDNGIIETLNSPTDFKDEPTSAKADSPMEISPKVQSPTSPGAGLLRNFTKRNKNSEKRPKTRDGKAENKVEQTVVNSPPIIDVEIPEITMERYSVMFKEIKSLPARSSSLSSNLLARRQAAAENTHLVPGGSLKTLNVSQHHRLGHVRSATEPSPRSPREVPSISHRLIPEEEADSSRELPHISTLIHRPRPIKRTRTAPPILASHNPRDQKLSPTFEADELDYDDRDRLTPTPPDPSPPSTPKSPPRQVNLPSIKEVKPLERDQRKNSWENSTEHSNDSAYEIITIGKRISENDMLISPTIVPPPTFVIQPPQHISRVRTTAVTPIKPPVAIASSNVIRSNSNKPRLETAVPRLETSITPSLSRSNSNKPRLETAVPPRVETVTPSLSRSNSQKAPRLDTTILPGMETVVPPRLELAVARTLSVKRANSTAKTTIVRSPSLKSNANKSASTTPRLPTTESTSAITTPLPSPAIMVSEPPKQEQPRPLLQSSYSILNQSQPSGLSRKESTRLEIKKEIWGEPKIKVDVVRDAKAALMPQMCVVEEDESRRSVWGLIEMA